MSSLGRWLLLSSLAFASAAFAQVPLHLHYQGYLSNAAGVPVNMPTSITFRLYATQGAGTALWTETHAAVPVASGNFGVMLGSQTALSLAIFDAARWLGVQAAGDAEMTPRQALGSAPFAYVAERANQLSGTATVQGSQIAGNIAGTQVTGTISNATIAGNTLTALGGHFVPAVGNTTTTVDSTGTVGEYAALAIGADGLPVISYYQRSSGLTAGRLKVAKCGNAACSAGTISVVETGTFDPDTGFGIQGVGEHTSIAIGLDGLPVIAYYDGTNRDLKVAKCVSAACTGQSTITTLHSAGDVGQYTSIAVGADGLPVISYVDYDNFKLKVAKCLDAACIGGATISTPDPTGYSGAGTSIKIGADGLPVVSYQSEFSGAGLRMLKCVQADCAAGSTIAPVDPVLAVGRFSSIAIGDDGFPVISYQGLGGLGVAKCFNAACTVKIQLVLADPGTGVQYTSIAVGQGGRPLIAYYDETNFDLRVARCANSTCTGTSLINAVDSAGDVGAYVSMAIGADGLPVIAYYDATNGDLKVLKCINQTCAPWQ